METHVSTTPYIETNQSKIELEKEFIYAWKSYPALWDPRNQYYTNKYKRLEYLKKLLEVYKKIKPGATTDDVRKKINIFRSNYKRELNKIEESRKRGCSDVVYSPRVWFFPLLNFLIETKHSMKLPQNSFDSEEEVRASREFEDFNGTTEETKTNITNVNEKSKIKEEIFEGHVCESYESISKRRRCENQDVQSSTSDAWPMHVYKYNPLAVIWSEKLERLCPIQKLYAEKAINDILFEAELGNLNKYSVLINPPTCSKPLT
ncbi:unnamed protein product [Danaus chrysippus]|uniref:(African queen) hypothetical protein n=1 Tax=Danaus chrysippus TaxID=151541 RepID=A0A8J2QBW4_9NEOP|nr:unnamed protein product [Danaus chrysippus]